MPLDLTVNTTLNTDTGGGGTTPPPSGDVSTMFGQFTRSGAGGVAVTGASIASGDPSGHWQISGGLLTPSGTGQDSITGTYTLTLDNAQTVGIAVEPGDYSARSMAEINAAFSHMTSAGGRSVTVRGVTITAPNFTTLGPVNTTFATQAVLQGEDGCKFEFAVIIAGTRNIIYRNFEIHRTDTPTGGENGAQDCVLGVHGTNATTIIDNLDIHGRDLDPLANYRQDGSYQNWNVIGIVFPYANGLTVRNSLLYDGIYGCRTVLNGTAGDNFIFEDNVVEFTYTDLIQLIFFSSGSLNSEITIQRNVMTGPVGRPYAGGVLYPDGTRQDPGEDPHVDVVQFVPTGNAPSGSRITNFTYRQNYFWIDRTRAQGLLVQGLVSFNGLILQNAIVCGNYFGTDSTHAVIGRMEGGVFNNNTLVRSSTSPDFDLRNERSEFNFLGGSTGNIVRRNIVEVASNSGTIINEIVIGQQGATIPYSTVFNGSNFGVEPTSFEALVDQFSVRPGGPADLAGAYDTGCFGSGYGTIGAPRSGGAGWSFAPGAET